MEITITHCRYAPRWDSLLTVIQEATNEPAELIRISREDKGCNYRSPGVYRLRIRQKSGVLPIKLTVLAGGHRQEGRGKRP